MSSLTFYYRIHAIVALLSALIELRQLSLNCAIVGFGLIDTHTNTKIAEIVNGTIIDLADFARSPSLNINATFSGAGIRSVVFEHNKSPKTKVENIAWFSLCGNTGDVFSPCSVLSVGRHTITATPFAMSRARGKSGTPYKVSFSIVNTGIGFPVSVAQPTASPSNKPFTLKLLNLVALSSTSIDVSSKSSKVSLQVIAQDFGEGLSEIAVKVNGNDKMYLTQSSCSYRDDSVIGPVFCNITLTFPQYFRKGNYSFQVSLESFGCEFIVFSSNELAKRSLPNTIQVVNTNEDRQAPSLLDFNLSDSTITIANGGMASVGISVIAQDVKSGLSSGRIEAVRVGSSPVEALIVVGDFVTPKRQLATIRFVLSFAWFASPPGNYSLRLHLTDSTGNTATFDATELKSRNHLFSVEVINDYYDGTAPELLNFTVLGSTSLNVISGPIAVKMQLLVRDNLSGATDVSVSMALKGGTELWARRHLDEPTAAGDAVLVTLTMVVPQNVESGRYLLRVFCSDAADNDIFFKSSDLQNAASPYYLDVHNTREDGRE